MKSPDGDRRLIFLVSPFVPYPPVRGVELRIFRMLKWLTSRNFRVVLVMPAEFIDDAAMIELRKVTHAIHWTKPALRTRLGMKLPGMRRALWEPLKRLRSTFHGELPVDAARPDISSPVTSSKKLGDKSIKAWFAPAKLTGLVGRLARRYRPHAVIVEYIFSAPIFDSLTHPTMKIIDTIDVFSRKEDQVLAYGIEDPLASSEAEERNLLLRADAIIAIQSREQALLKAIVPERQVILTGIDLDVSEPASQNPAQQGTVVVVASDNPLNVHGLREFLIESWPAIRLECPSASLHIVGRVGAMCPTDDVSVHYSGWVDDLDAIYAEASVVINPTIAGTGLKIKSVQALAHGKPLVAWTNGVEGLEYEGTPPFKECRSWREFSDATIRLLTLDSERAALAQRATAFARDEFSGDKVYASLAQLLTGSAADALPSRAFASVVSAETVR